MSSQQTIRTAAQNFVEHMLKENRAPIVRYDQDGARVLLSETDVPKSVRSNEEVEQYQIDRNNGMERAIIPSNWTLVVECEYSHEVDLHDLFMRIFRVESRIPAGTSHAAFRMLLTSRSVRHPVRQEPAHGSLAVLTFLISPTRGN